ncbi:hypothetical protein ACFP9V_00815 [Deinococcus radiopugnans]
MQPFWLVVTNLGRDEVFIVVLALYTWLWNPGAGATWVWSSRAAIWSTAP